MRYKNISEAKFISRPNRFIATVEKDGEELTVHVKNTGRCRELLTKNAKVYIQKSENETRKTKYDLVMVKKGDRIINMDSQAPNTLFREWIERGNLFSEISLIRPESRYKNSRFDFYMEADGKRIFAEVKGVTLEEDGIVRFPDAPTQRGVRHIKELIDAKACGYEAYIAFIIQMNNVHHFEPNYKTHREFGEVLAEAESRGVNILAIDCHVTEDSVEAQNIVPVRL
ncbi:MAG: DNA/RNA nuclease SfsA [Clostridia bacterium]|nr:DNA/RNA nuclease SfsA [Clostridia bacterium]